MSQDRRTFFMGAAAALSATQVWGANDRINVAIVGLGGRGSAHLNIYSKLPEARVAGLCDVNQAARERSQATLLRNTGEKAKEFADMREVFADKSIEAVSIATPNHWHALSAIWAMKAGKDVYGEKPACYNVYEGLKMIDTLHSTKRIMQVGSQHRSTPFKMKAIEAIQGGLIGKVYAAKGLCYKRRASIGHKADEPTPPGLDWDMFLGPAPMRPYNELRFRYNWHWFWDTGNGDIGNQGVHELGIARWGMGDPGYPKSAFSQGGKYAYDDDQETPNTLLSSFDFGGRELVFEVRGLLTNAESAATPPKRNPGPNAPAPTATAPKTSAPLNVMTGDFFYGTEGWAAMSDNGFQAFKGESNEMIMEERPERGPDTTSLHMQNFLAACRSRNQKSLHDGLENAVLSANMCHLANISYRVGRKINLDGPKIVNDAEASKLLTRDYRKPYVV
ncbi:Gfo/Idh/MocA family protein [Bryobacter aggregatus]|uniref:Gfo/Idh/MocA family protein n=1 Tax=Bryobacter aggregatus TaxID=360054 RepID=UPI0004E20CD6|nr:Gfo/Idh/MocA family oxidoreductase [Bryobacter aggregatus]